MSIEDTLICSLIRTLRMNASDKQLNNNNNNNLAVALPRGGSTSTVSKPVELEFGVLVFVEGGKRENPEKNPRSKDENQQQTQPTCDARSRNRTRATAVGGQRSQHCAIPAPL